MKQMPRISTISSYKITNNELTKETGMIPYLLHKKYGFDSTVVTIKQGDYPYLNNEVKGLKVHFVKRTFRVPHVVNFSHLWYVIRHAKKIDILNVYFLCPDAVVLAWVFKLLNKKGLVYLKLDAHLNRFVDFFYDKSGFFKRLKIKFFTKAYASKYFDLISYETMPRSNELEGYPIKLFKEKMFYLPTGFYVPNMNEQELIEKMHSKKKIILICGRIGFRGFPYKNHDRLLNILPQLNFKDWSIKFVGPVEPYFEKLVADFFKNNPDLKNKVIFTGAVSDKKQLQNEYLSSAVYLVTSVKEESYNISLIEALNAGCYVVSTDMGVAFDAIQNDAKIGQIITLDNLPKKLQDIIDGKINVFEHISERHHRAEAFSWEVNIPRLYQRLSEICK
ncbi:MAG: glycosyltransferase [Bacteroidales bacterium]|jgi:glycosyltransferase involved in cell wall biosynthesis|nr:glycosyltransferase [Bacteroidales bacterium]